MRRGTPPTRLQSFRNRMYRLYLDDAGSASTENKDNPILGGVSAPRRERHSCFDVAADRILSVNEATLSPE